jgi:predicted Rdx family selenoprotein
LIREEFGVEPELIEGEGGIFDVVADGELVFSKHEVGRLPMPDEVQKLLRKKGASHL